MTSSTLNTSTLGGGTEARPRGLCSPIGCRSAGRARPPGAPSRLTGQSHDRSRHSWLPRQVNTGGAPGGRALPFSVSAFPRFSIFLVLLLALLPFNSLLFFSPQFVVAGQWWRLLTHPFVHVSWYHALLDGVAFLLLWQSLDRRRLVYILLPAAGSLLAALWFWPAIGQTGLCGLSGVAHGLMAISAVEMIQRRDRLGWLSLVLVAGKSVWEAVTGTVCFAWLHFGLMGTPVAVAHLGGVLGGLLAVVLAAAAVRRRTCGKTA